MELTFGKTELLSVATFCDKLFIKISFLGCLYKFSLGVVFIGSY